jgi:hypothetical protein
MDIKDTIKKMFGTKQKLDKTISAQAPKDSAEAKAVATKNKEPYIEVIGLDIDADNPVQGAFELDWNKYFVEELRSKGFQGVDDESVVDQWFNAVCKNVALSEYEAMDEKARNSFTETKDLGDGYKEVK